MDKYLTLQDGKKVLILISPLRVITSSTTVTATDYLLLVDASLGVVNITMPQASLFSGREYKIAKTDSSLNQVVVLPFSGDTVLNDTQKEICFQNTVMVLNSDGQGNWV
jgi:hypothetical protein